MYKPLHVKYPLFLSGCKETRIFSTDKFSNIKFHANPSSGSQIVLCGRTDITKLTVPFRNFVNAPKNG